MSKSRYPNLSRFAAWCWLTGYLVIVAGLCIGGLIALQSDPIDGFKTIGLSVFGGLGLVAISDLIPLLIDMEAHAASIRQTLIEIREHGGELRDTTKQCQAWLAKIGKPAAAKSVSDSARKKP